MAFFRHCMLAAAILVLTAGCGGRPDPDQARLCRIAAVALVPEPIEILRQTALPPVNREPGVDIAFRFGTAPVRDGFAQCRFAPTEESGHATTLVGLLSDGGPMSDTGLFMLRRFWLDTPEGDRADPQPVEIWAGAPLLSRRAGYALQILLNALPGMASYGLLAASYSLIYGLIGRINLAFGEMAAIGGAGALTGVAFLNNPSMGWLVAVALVAAAWAAVLHGVAIGRWVFTPLRRSTRQQGLVATVGLALVLEEYLRLVQGPTPLWITPLRTAPIAVARTADFAVTLTPIGLVLTALSGLIATAMLGLMSRTQFGRNWRAMADDAGAAALMGVSPGHLFAQSFALASALAGMAGAGVVLVTGSFGASYGTVLGLKALLAAVLGGIGSVRGAFLGGILLGALEAGWSAFFPIENRDLVVFIALACALVARPGGLLGYRDLTPRRV